MSKRSILDNELLQITLDRLCQQLIENHDQFEESVILAIQPRGVIVGERIKSILEKSLKKKVAFGHLDVTFHRDDFRRKEAPLKANATIVPFIIEDKRVILVDDVLYTGRTVRAALDAMIAFGRPKDVELLALVDRKFGRDLPIEAQYVGKEVICLETEHVQVDLHEENKGEDKIWLVTNNDKK
ncbi:MAG: bifunctional pyr operon transcriptional regulator/uracil phosphoribosyltransferase PyrR [Cytophagaceae bacterium]|nr:bifunctional pyr operon transcriptional regulator/uracil phosphoribosyltransferase PyrR [Cytophagaceae bacterium]